MALARGYLYQAITLLMLCLLEMLDIRRVILCVATKEKPPTKLPHTSNDKRVLTILLTI